VAIETMADGADVAGNTLPNPCFFSFIIRGSGEGVVLTLSGGRSGARTGRHGWRDFTAKFDDFGNLEGGRGRELASASERVGRGGKQGSASRMTDLIPPCQASGESSDERPRKREEESSRGSDGQG
jgi:hypothetical protein